MTQMMNMPQQANMVIALSPTITETLQRRKKTLEEDLARVNHCLSLLEQSPGVAEVFDAVSQITGSH